MFDPKAVERSIETLARYILWRSGDAPPHCNIHYDYEIIEAEEVS